MDNDHLKEYMNATKGAAESFTLNEIAHISLVNNEKSCHKIMAMPLSGIFETKMNAKKNINQTG